MIDMLSKEELEAYQDEGLSYSRKMEELIKSHFEAFARIEELRNQVEALLEQLDSEKKEVK